jgi:hypothetical protein
LVTSPNTADIFGSWLTNLQHLSLASTTLSDAAATKLAKLASLLSLSLSYARGPLGDGCLTGLSSLKDLQSLSLENTPVTDAGLKHITGLVNCSL